jgi:hypothetical protein
LVGVAGIAEDCRRTNTRQLKKKIRKIFGSGIATIKPMVYLTGVGQTKPLTGDKTMQATISSIETMTASRETYNAIIRDAVRLPVAGLIKSYKAVEYDDFGNTVAVFIRSTERPNENGEITWTQATVLK